MSFTFRLARPEDAPALYLLNAAFNGDTGVTEADVRRSLLTSPEIVLIAMADGAPAGFCCAQVHHSFCYPAPVAEVTEMYVAEAFRRQGCAAGLLAFLEERLRREYGADEIHLLTGTGNLAAQAAYRRAGFAAKDVQYMRRRLPPADTPAIVPLSGRSPDVRVRFTFNGTRHSPVRDGYRPQCLITQGVPTTGVHHYEDAEWVSPDGTALGTITFISPEAYPHCLWPGKVLPLLEGSCVVGQAEVLAVLNPLLDAAQAK